MAAIKYPVYVISKGRSDICYTAKFLLRDKVDFKIVIEPQEESKYRKFYSNLFVLPFSNLGLGGIPARNWVWEHAKNMLQAKRHWILDDNIDGIVRQNKGRRIPCNSQEAFLCAEEFVDRYENIAIAELNYRFFVPPKLPAFYLNSRVYSCLLIDNALSFRWRGRYNEDTDLCLQALMNNYCTVNINVFLTNKKATMSCKGGNTDELYKDNGRLKMARSLEHQWRHVPNLVKTIRRFNRPQHCVNWKMFKTQLKFTEKKAEKIG